MTVSAQRGEAGPDELNEVSSSRLPLRTLAPFDDTSLGFRASTCLHRSHANGPRHPKRTMRRPMANGSSELRLAPQERAIIEQAPPLCPLSLPILAGPPRG